MSAARHARWLRPIDSTPGRSTAAPLRSARGRLPSSALRSHAPDDAHSRAEAGSMSGAGAVE